MDSSDAIHTLSHEQISKPQYSEPFACKDKTKNKKPSIKKSVIGPFQMRFY